MRFQESTAVAAKPRQRTIQTRWMLGVLYFCIVTSAFILMAGAAQGQDTKPGQKKGAPAPQNPALANRPISLKTKDGIALRGFYFPSDKGKEAVTVMVMHEWGSQAAPYQRLLVALKDAGCAVVMIDYRGHGGSRKHMDARGREKDFNFAQMGQLDVNNIIMMDMEETKRFLVKENNEGRLNLNALVVIGDGAGCILASSWTKRDWSFATVGSKKQGQDVKGLVLISPEKVLKRVSLDKAMSSAAIMSMPMLLMCGESGKSASVAKQIYKKVEAIRKRASGGKVSNNLQLQLTKTSLSGPNFIDQQGVIPTIVKFVTENVSATDPNNEWVLRQ